jgi:hypothetical protein
MEGSFVCDTYYSATRFMVHLVERKVIEEPSKGIEGETRFIDVVSPGQFPQQFSIAVNGHC